MEDEKIKEPNTLEQPNELEVPDEESTVEKYKRNGIYEYALKKNGKLDYSKAKITYENGDVFIGDLKKNRYEGLGRYYWSDGGTYEGEFKKGSLYGEGIYKASNKDVYEGEFWNGAYNGNGKYTWADGSRYEGFFQGGKFVEGNYIDAEGNVYSCKCKYGYNGGLKKRTLNLIKEATSAAEQAKSEAPKTEKVEETAQVNATAARAEQAEQTTQEKVTEKADKPQASEQAQAHAEEKGGVTEKGAAKSDNGLLSKDRALLTTIRKSRVGADFKALYSGAVNKSENSEKKLVAILDFFTNSDTEQMQRIFKSSNLFNAEKGTDYVVGLINDVKKEGVDYFKEMKGRKPTNVAQHENGAAK